MDDGVLSSGRDGVEEEGVGRFGFVRLVYCVCILMIGVVYLIDDYKSKSMLLG